MRATASEQLGLLANSTQDLLELFDDVSEAPEFDDKVRGTLTKLAADLFEVERQVRAMALGILT